MARELKDGRGCGVLISPCLVSGDITACYFETEWFLFEQKGRLYEAAPDEDDDEELGFCSAHVFKSSSCDLVFLHLPPLGS